MNRIKIAKWISAALMLTSFTFVTPVLDEAANAAGVALSTGTTSSISSLNGAYIIDSGYMSPGATSQTVAQGIKQYGLVYALVKAKIPVQWVINKDKTSLTSAGKAFDQNKGNDGIDFSFSCTGTSKDYKTGAFVIAKEFQKQAESIVTTWKAKGVVVDGPCTNELAANTTVPVYATIKSWPRAVLDAQNGAVAIKYFDNAEIAQGSLTDPNNPPAYRFASPDQLTACDDVYVMPHADPTFATHKNLINFIKAGGDFYASCHAVSVIENMVDPAAPTVKVMNLLATDGLVNYDNHVQGKPAYAIFDTGTASVLTDATAAGLSGLRSGDPIAQFLGRTDAAQQQGSEQMFMTDKARSSVWRPTTQLIMYDPDQADKVTGTKTNGPATSALYGPAYGNSSYGQVMYIGGHTSAKGTADDVAAQRLFFNFLLTASVTSSATPADGDRTPTVSITTPAPSTLSPGDEVSLAGNAVGGSGNFRFTWASTCYNGSTKLASGGTFTSPNSNATTFIAPSSGGVSSCNLTLTAVDTCGRFAFGYQTFSLAPVADVQVTQTVSASSYAGSNLVYTAAVKNNGLTPGSSDGGVAGSVGFKWTLPANSTFVSLTQPSSGTCTWASGAITCNLGDMADESTLSFTYTINPSLAGTLTSSVNVTTGSLDSNQANNKDSDTTTINEPASSQVSIEKYPSSQQVATNGVAAFRLTVKNTGNSALSNIQITDTFTSGTLECERAGTFYFRTSSSPAVDTITALAKGETWRASCTLTGVASGAGTNTFTASHPSFGSNPTTTVTFTGGNALSMTKSVSMVSKKIAHVAISIINKLSASNVTNMIFNDIFPAGTSEYQTSAGIKNTASISSYSMSGSAGTVQGVLASEKFGDYTSDTNYGSLTGNGGNGWSANWVFLTNDATSSSMKIAKNTYSSRGSGFTKTNAAKEENAFRITATKGKSYSLSRKLQLKTANKAVSVFFECVSDLTGTSVVPPSIKVELGDQVLGTVDCPATRQTISPLTIDASKITGVGSSYGDVTLKLSTVDKANQSTTSNVIIDDIFVVSGLLAADQFSVTNSYYGLMSPWTMSSTSLAKSFSTSSSTMGTAIKQSSSSSNTYTMSNTFSIDSSKHDTSTATLSFRMTQLQSGDQIVVYRDNSVIQTITSSNQHTCSNKCGNGTQIYANESVTIPFTSSASIKIATKYTNNSGYVDDVILTASALGSIDSGGLSGVSLADVIAKLKTISLALNKEIQIGFDMLIDSPWTGADPLGFVNVATLNSSLNPDSTTAVTYAMDYYTIPTTDIVIEKTDTQTVVTAGNATTYNYKLLNTGSIDVVIDSISDPGCNSGAPGRLTKNGVSNNLTPVGDTLTAGSNWTFSCITPILNADTETVVTVDFTDYTDPANPASDSSEDSLPITVPNPSLQVTVTPSTKSIYKGGDVTYTYSVKNNGNIPLTIDSVVGSNCNPGASPATSALGAVYLSGDPNGDGYIEVGDTWSFQCRTLAISSNQTGQTVTATGSNHNYSPTISTSGTSSTYSVTVFDKPTLTFTKQVKNGSGGTLGTSISVGPSNDIYYVYTVTVDSGTATSVVVNDTGCRVSSTPTSGDSNNNSSLDAGETWTFTCHAGQLTQTETSTGSAGGKDGLNNRVSSASIDNTVEVLSPELLIEVRPDNLYILKGKSNKYTYIVKNTGGIAFTSLAATDSNCPTLQNSFNGKSLAVGATLTVACTVNNLSSDLTTTFYVTGTYTGGTHDASPSVVKVFVINPTFQIKKYVKAYAANADTSTVMTAGFTDTTTAITADNTDYIFFRYEVKAMTGDGATTVAGLNALALKSFNDPDCIQAVQILSGGFNTGDSNFNGYIDPNETWNYVCRAVPALSVYKAPGSTPLLMASPGKFKVSSALPPVSYALKAKSPMVWANAVGDTSTSTVQIGVISSLDDPNSITPILSLTDTSTVTVNINQPAPASYTVTYDGNGSTGGSAPTGSPSTVAMGSTATVLANTGNYVRTDYTFTGWNSRPDGSGTSLDASGTASFVMPGGNVTLYAMWTSNLTYTVTYDGNGNTGGSVPPSQTNKAAGASVTVQTNSGTLVRTGYTFQGWNTGAGGSGNHYAPSATLTMPASDVTLYAEWLENSQVVAGGPYQVTYNGNGNTGGSVPTDATNYLSGDQVTVKSNTGSLVRTGYTLTSWNTSANGTGSSYALSGSATFLMATSDVVLYAIWTADATPAPSGGGGGGSTLPTYKVKYDPSGSTSGSVPIDANNYQNGSQVIVLSNLGTLSRTGYTFGGWSTSPNGGGNTYSPNGTFPMPNGDITLYPIWIANQSSKIIYQPNGAPSGAAPVDPNTYQQNSAGTVLGNTGNLYYRGYTFNGWNTAANGSGTAYAPGATVNVGNSGVILFAQWKALPFVTITYNAGGATGGSMPTDTNKYYQLDVAKIQTNIGNLTRNGYKFVGWNSSADGTGTVYPATGNAVLVIGTTNVNLYPEWEKIAVPGSNVKQGKMVFKVYFGMNSVAIDAIAKKNIREHFIILKSKMTAKSKVTITVEGWVQPNNPPGNITYLSTNRAKNVTAAIKALGLKGTYRLSFPGLAPLNDAKSRYAEVIFTWTDSK